MTNSDHSRPLGVKGGTLVDTLPVTALSSNRIRRTNLGAWAIYFFFAGISLAVGILLATLL